MQEPAKTSRTAGRAIAVVVTLTLAMVLGACDSENGVDASVTLPEGGGTEAEAPETQAPQTEAPEADAAPEVDAAATASSDDDSSSVPVWVWVVLGLLLIGIVAWGAARMGSSRPPDGQQPPPPA